MSTGLYRSIYEYYIYIYVYLCIVPQRDERRAEQSPAEARYIYTYNISMSTGLYRSIYEYYIYMCVFMYSTSTRRATFQSKAQPRPDIFIYIIYLCLPAYIDLYMNIYEYIHIVVPQRDDRRPKQCPAEGR